MTTSKEGVERIQDFEGYVSRPYFCAAGKKTIGFGHVIRPGETFTELSREEATELLKTDLQYFEAVIDKAVEVPVTQAMFDALVSFVYNCGDNAFLKSTLLRKLNEGDYEGAAAEFPRWCHAGPQVLNGLLARRRAEQALFLSQEVA